ncbi:MAG: OmpH family outer membrane protein [Vulcanimicrobiota bacterium]
MSDQEKNQNIENNIEANETQENGQPKEVKQEQVSPEMEEKSPVLPETQESKSRNLGIIASAVAVIAIIIIGIFLMNKMEPRTELPPVGSISRDEVMDTREFKTANEKAQELTKEYEKKFEEETKNLDENNPEDVQKILELRQEYQKKLMEESNQLTYPLMKKAEAAVAAVALEKGLHTVLDKGVVVAGTQDITKEVIQKMNENEKIEMPDEEQLSELSKDSRIGYFDKTVVVSLPDFRKADEQLQQLEQELREEMTKEFEGKELTEEQQMQMQIMFAQRLRQEQENLYAPLFRQVNRSVKEVAEEENLDLVVNKEHVMYGGKNLTDKVANKLAVQGE